MAWRFVFLLAYFLFTTRAGDHETVSFLIQILEDDGLPTSICLDCIVKINVAYELRKQCQKADIELRKLYGKALRTNVAGSFVTKKVSLFLYE